MATCAQGWCHIPPLLCVPASCTEPSGFDHSFQRAKKSGRNSLLCVLSEQRASHRVIEKALWKRSCSPLPAANPWNAVPWAHPSSRVPCLGCPHPHPAPAGLCRGTVLCPDPLPSMALAQRWQGAGAWSWGELEEMQEGLVARMHHGNAPEVLPCTAAPSHDGSTLWARAHSLAPLAPVVFPWPFK